MKIFLFLVGWIGLSLAAPSINVRQMLPEIFNNPNVVMADPARVKTLVENLVLGGSERLHVISDFDRTLTKHWVNGERAPISHSIITRSCRISEESKELIHYYFTKYYPIEISLTLPHEEKVKAMVEWWTLVHDEIIKAKLSKHDLSDMVKETWLSLRDGAESLLNQCKAAKVPFLVFSAGLADVIREFIHQCGLWSENTHVISNNMIFDENDIIVGFQDPVIHTLNKDEAVIIHRSYYETVAHRRHVIVMGDSLGDLQMSHGLDHDIEFKVGFLNHDEERLLPSYLNAFDIVILKDSSFEPIQLLLEAIINYQ